MANELSREQIVIEAEGVEEAIRKAEELTRAYERTAQAAGQAGSYGALPAEGMRPGYLPMPPIRSSRVTSAQRTDYGSAALVQAAREAQRIARELDRAGGTWMSRMNAQIRSAVAEAKQLNMGGLRGGLGAVPGVAVAASGGALWARGFAGTLESNRLNRELDLLGREVAGAFKPVTDEFTRSIRDLREWLQRMSPAGQDRLMAAGLVAGGAAGMKAGGMGNSFWKNAGLLAIAGYGADKFDLSAKSLRRGFEANEARGLTGWFGRQLGYGGSEFTQREVQDSGYQRFSSIKDPAKRKAAIEAELKEVQSMADQLNKFRQDNPWKFRAQGLSEVFNVDLFGTGDGRNEYSERDYLTRSRELAMRERTLRGLADGGTAIGPNNSRRRVTPDDIQYGEVGSAYDDAQLGLLKTSYTVAEESLRELQQIRQYLQQVTGGSPVSPPDLSRDTR